MVRAQIIKAPTTNRGWFGTTTKNTDLSQRDTLEEIIVNLATALEIENVHKRQNSRGGYFYEVQASGFACYQSASNTILALSQRLSHQI